jgi:hypothetical protein
MPKSGTYGSVRGVPGNRHPYRDRQHHINQRVKNFSNSVRTFCRGSPVDQETRPNFDDVNAVFRAGNFRA